MVATIKGTADLCISVPGGGVAKPGRQTSPIDEDDEDMRGCWKWDFCAADAILRATGGGILNQKGDLLSYGDEEPAYTGSVVCAGTPQHLDRCQQQLKLESIRFA